jgi:hypothetical protein
MQYTFPVKVFEKNKKEWTNVRELSCYIEFMEVYNS